jgi:hypothetical protein
VRSCPFHIKHRNAIALKPRQAARRGVATRGGDNAGKGAVSVLPFFRSLTPAIR